MKNIHSFIKSNCGIGGISSVSRRYLVLFITLLSLGVGQMWGASSEYGNGKVIYLDISNGSTTEGWRKDQASLSYKIKMYYNDSDDSKEIIGEYCATQIEGTNVYYVITNNDHVRFMQALRCAGNCGTQHNYSYRIGCSSRSYDHDNCFYLPSDKYNYWNQWNPAWKCYVPDMASATISRNPSCVIYGGDGSSETPFLVANGANIVLDASATSVVTADNAPTKEYKYWYKVNDGSQTQLRDFSSSSSHTFKASSTTGTTYEIEVEARNNNNSNYSANNATSSKIYFKTVAPIYAVLGDFNGWTASSTYNFSGSDATGYTASFILDKGNHTFKAVVNDVYYGNGQTYERGSSSPSNTLSNEGGNMTINADVTGNYTFSFNFSAKTLSVTYPTKHTVTTGAYPSAAASAPSISPALEDGYLAAGTSVTLTKQSASTGYTWKEWNTGNTGTGSQLGTGYTYSTTLSGNLAVYAIYTPNTYSVVFNKNHVDATGTMSNQAFTYGAAATALTANAFVRDGYHFDGWATTSDGNVVYTDGQSVSNLTSDNNGTFNLYAHWTKSELTGITLDPTYAVQNEHPDITITPSISPVPSGTTVICWGLYSNSGCTSEVAGVSFSADPSSGANTVTFPAPNAAGTYYVKATFRAGSTCDGTELNSVTESFVVHPTSTVTVKAKVGDSFIPDAEYDQTSNTVTANTTRAEEVNVPEIPGYDFVNWTLGDNMAKTDAEFTANPIHITATAASTLTANYTYHDYTVTYPNEATAHCVFSGKSESVNYKSTGSFTVVPAAGYSIAVSATDESGSVSLSKNGNLYSFVQGTSAVTISVTPTELENTVTVVNGDAAEVTAKASTQTATVTAAAAPTGKKFAYWAIDDAITLVGCVTTDREITFNATRNTTITAVYTNRDSKTVHFAKPFNWNTVTAVFSNSGSDESSQTEATSTMTYQGANYYTFTYFTDDNGEGDNKSAQASWNQVVFSNNGENPLTAKTINNGYYYAEGAEEANGRTMPYAEWYIRGLLNGNDNWDSNHYDRPLTVNGATATFAFGVTNAGEQYYRIYRISTGEWFRYGTENKDLRIDFDSPMTLSKNSNSADQFTSELGVYIFSLTNLNSNAPSLTITHPADRTFTSISVSAGANGSISSETAAITTLGEYMPTDISATADPGYRFKEWVATGGVVVENPTSASSRATATADGGTLTATFTNEGIVYLDKSAISSTWTTTPYVYFYSGSYWNNEKGSGSKNILHASAMTNITGTNIWYYDYSSAPGISSTRNYISFTNGDQTNKNNFDQTSAIYRGDFYPEMNMFVPQNYITNYLNKYDSKQTAYYNNGYWMKYNDAEAGYKLCIYDGQGNKLQQAIPFITENAGERNSYKAILHVSGAADAKLELVGYDTETVNGVPYAGTYYGNTGNITNTISEWNWAYSPNTGKANLKLNARGDYEFTLNCNTDGKLYLKVTYPLAIGDFRIKYNGLRTTKDAEKTNVYSDVIPRLTEDGTRLDTVSFFVHNSGGNTATLSAEKVSSIASDGTISWVDSDVELTGDAISSLDADVYTFKITQTKSGGTYTLSYENLGPYNGNYYVRTDYADGGWVAYKQADNTLHPTNYANAGYNAYFCRYIPSGSVKFCIANQYNSALTEEKVSDINADASGTIQQAANTRFEYDTTTNVVSRSYIGGSNVATYLYIRDTDPDKIFKENGSSEGITLTSDTAAFIDQENWIYMLDVRATTRAQYRLEAEINGNRQYFVGTVSTSETLIDANGADGKQAMRLVYDFKNNHLIKAWKPSVAVNGTIPLDADVMLLRVGQAAAVQLNFNTADSKLTEVKNVYGVLQFNKSTLTGGGNSTQHSLYWISFPFDVKLKDMFGFGTYGEDYIIRRYNGAKRAQIGWFAETNTFWETMDPNSNVEEENTMKAYEGYMVALDKGLLNSSDSRWSVDGKAISELYLYFPSTVAVGTLAQTNKEITLDSIPCRIDRFFAQDIRNNVDNPRNHKITDSNWRIVGTGSLHDSELSAKTLEGGATTFSYYSWTASSNSLTPTTCVQNGSAGATQFLASHAVMVQWAGKITWTGAAVPAALAPRRAQTDKKNYNIELDLNYNGEMADRTYVVLQENASADFVLNEDLYKATNANLPNIYAYAGAYDCGVSVMPIESTTVPVGVITRKRGTYTFSMPNDFSGTVTLIDTYAQTRTNLALDDYEVFLEKGTFNDRFLLEVDIQAVTTNLDWTSDGFSKDKTRKVMIDGILYIVRDGEMFSIHGTRVK